MNLNTHDKMWCLHITAVQYLLVTAGMANMILSDSSWTQSQCIYHTDQKHMYLDWSAPDFSSRQPAAQ